MGYGCYPETVLPGYRRKSSPTEGKLHTNRTAKQARKYHQFNPLVPIQDILVVGAKGSLEDVKEEARKFASNQQEFAPEVVDHVVESLRNCCVKTRADPLSYEEVLSLYIDRKTSAGQPWKELAATKGDLLEAHGLNTIIAALHAYEKGILDLTEWPTHVWDCLSKEDKYKKEKLDNNRLRTIQAGDFFYLCLLIRWTAPAVKSIYERHPRYMVKFTPEDYIRKITLEFAQFDTFGVDGTGLDRGIPGAATAVLLHELCTPTDTPEEIETFLARVANEGPLQFGDGSYDDSRVGGNISGIWITTLTNCFLVDLVLTETACDTFSCLPDQLDLHIRWSITGDDVLLGLPKSDTNKDLMRRLHDRMQFYNIEFKLDCMADGSLFPAGLAMHAPYLGRVSVVAGGYVLTVPLEPRRNLGWFHSRPREQTPQQALNSWVGIRESVMPYYVCAALSDGSYKVPRVVCEFMKVFDWQYEHWERQGLVTPLKKIQWIPEALSASGALEMEC